MLRIGITGGIGSGKSVVAKIFAELGIPVYDADTAAKRLLAENAPLRQAIIALLGPGAYEGQKPNRSYIAARVFSDPSLLAAYNAIIHPAVIAAGENWFAQQEANGFPYAIKEAALFFETGSAAGLYQVVGVYAPAALRIRRVMQRDGSSREDVLRRMASQLDESIKMKLCDQVVRNDDQVLVVPQVLALDRGWRGIAQGTGPAGPAKPAQPQP